MAVARLLRTLGSRGALPARGSGPTPRPELGGDGYVDG